MLVTSRHIKKLTNLPEPKVVLARDLMFGNDTKLNIAELRG